MQVTTTAPEPVVEAFEGCEESGFLCDRVYEWTESETMADWTAFLVDRPLKILMILLVAWVASRLTRRAVRRLGERIGTTTAEVKGRVPGAARRGEPGGGAASARLTQRTTTITGVLNSVASITIWTLALLVVLGELGVNLGPLVAGAGIAGVALGFGAQSLVKDFLTGIFMLVEDQYGVGDVVDLGEATGSVENMSLRVTTVRDVSGTVWYVPNGQIVRVANKSQQEPSLAK